MLVAPSEGPVLKRLGKSSSVPERYGADVLIVARGQRIGVQRKATADFVASVLDGRLTREVAQMQRLDLAVLAIEGRFEWTTDGEWLTSHGKWDRLKHRQYLFSLFARGMWVVETRDQADTVEVCRELERWARKDKHRSLDKRPGCSGEWGRPTSKEFGIHLLQGFDGVGPELAERIWDHFDGVPLQWAVGKEGLEEVDGIGPTRAKRMLEAFR